MISIKDLIKPRKVYKVTKKKIWKGKLNFGPNEKLYNVEVSEWA